MGKIDDIITQRNLKSADCGYHTIRTLENNGRVRALVVKGETVLHIEYTCPKCGHSAYKTQEWVNVSKGAKIKFILDCEKCGLKIKVEKLKGKK